MGARRCSRCGALVSADAEWCGQCYAPLHEAAASPSGAPPPPPPSIAPRLARGGVGVGERLERPSDSDGPPSGWRCPTCDTRNALDANVCRVCGTSFGRRFDDPAAGPAIDANAAGFWSLLLPGLGHWFAGRHAHAVARFVLAVWIVGMLAVALASRGGKDGIGSLAMLVLLFAISTVALWAEWFVDARPVAAGSTPWSRRGCCCGRASG